MAGIFTHIVHRIDFDPGLRISEIEGFQAISAVNSVWNHLASGPAAGIVLDPFSAMSSIGIKPEVI